MKKTSCDLPSLHAFFLVPLRDLCCTLMHGKKARPQRYPASRSRYLPLLASPSRGCPAVLSSRLDDDASVRPSPGAVPSCPSGGLDQPGGEVGAEVGFGFHDLQQSAFERQSPQEEAQGEVQKEVGRQDGAPGTSAADARAHQGRGRRATWVRVRSRGLWGSHPVAHPSSDRASGDPDGTRCLRCGRLNKGHAPSEHETGYGPRLTALIGEVAGTQGSSRSTVQEFCLSVLGIHMSKGGGAEHHRPGLQGDPTTL